MGGGTGQRKLDKFEELIREAIAILIKRGEISISRKKPPPAGQDLKVEPRKRSM
jgi:hypothetical protein